MYLSLLISLKSVIGFHCLKASDNYYFTLTSSIDLILLFLFFVPNNKIFIINSPINRLVFFYLFLNLLNIVFDQNFSTLNFILHHVRSSHPCCLPTREFNRMQPRDRICQKALSHCFAC